MLTLPTSIALSVPPLDAVSAKEMFTEAVWARSRRGAGVGGVVEWTGRQPYSWRRLAATKMRRAWRLRWARQMICVQRAGAGDVQSVCHAAEQRAGRSALRRREITGDLRKALLAPYGPG